jgi:hypothetical protein
MKTSSAGSERPSPAAIGACAVLAIVSYVLSYTAIRTKSPTIDEPLHFMGAYARVFHGDFRLDPEDPPLWCWLAMAPLRSDTLRVDWGIPFDTILRSPGTPMAFVDNVLWFTRGNDGSAAIDRSRAAMATLMPVLVLLCAWCGRKLAGPVAAVGAAILSALDPLLLAHAPLVKNDVAITLVTLAMTAAAASVMALASPARIALLCVCCGAALTTKFSGVPLVLLALSALLIRAIAGPRSWTVFGRPVTKRTARVAVWGAIAGACVMVSMLAVWSVYRFRYAPTVGSDKPLNEEWFVDHYASQQLMAELDRRPTDAERAAWQPDITTRLITWANRNKLAPNAYLMGMLYTRGSSLVREAYLLGELRLTGWWYYFPAALVFKTPLATIATLLLAGTALAIRRWRASVFASATNRHAALAALVMSGGYFALAMTWNLNIGMRHVMPVLPIIYVATSVVLATVLGGLTTKARRAGIAIGSILAAGLLVESRLAWPDYIAFFNAPSGGAPGGIRLLADSNLDWGQDLPLLRDWQRRNPQVPLYFSYFGAVPPESYGIKYTNLHGGHWTQPPELPTSAGVIAVSATKLQGLYLPAEVAPTYYDLRVNRVPREVLGGTIYLYDFP